MTLEILATFAILAVAVILFVTNRVRMDLVALLVLGALALTGLLTPAEALAGFANPAVVTVWAVFILGAGLALTGVANQVGSQILRLAGTDERRLIVVIMLSAGILSGFMNSIGVVVLLLPVVMDISRKAGIAPSRLLLPLASGALLGGLTTLIGTPPNVIVSEALREEGYAPFGFFAFTPVGLTVLLTGALYMVVVGRRMLPARNLSDSAGRPANSEDLKRLYGLDEGVAVVRLEPGSAFVGATLAQSRLRDLLGGNVLGILRNGQTRLAPLPSEVLQAGDRLIIQGAHEQLVGINGHPFVLPAEQPPDVEEIAVAEVVISELQVMEGSPLAGQTLAELAFRARFGVNVLAFRQNGQLIRDGLPRHIVRAGDVLLVQGTRERTESLAVEADLRILSTETAVAHQLDDQLMALRIPEGSALSGKTLIDSRLGFAFDLVVLGIVRDGVTRLLPPPEEVLQAGDTLLVEASAEELRLMQGLQGLELDRDGPALFAARALESADVGLAEVVLAPHTPLAGQTLRSLNFREKYGLTVLAIWRAGSAYRDRLGDIPLKFGDALLVHGSRRQLQVLGSELDFVVLRQDAQTPPRLNKMPVALAVMGIVLLPVMLGWMPIAIMAVVGAALMVLTGCLSMDEAYRAIEWRAVFLIAGMLALGTALDQTGAAQLVANAIVSLSGDAGPTAVSASFYVLAMLATQVMPTQAVAALQAPIVVRTAADLNVSPYPMMMILAVAIAASALNPVAHAANVLIMGPGGYQFRDFLKLGLPLALLIMLVSLVLVPLLWPY